MAKFISHDGSDSTGLRAEISVQTGTGTIKEINGRGTPNEEGSYRNYEVVFTPDNPKLLKKMYGLIDTHNNPLWDYVQQAFASGQNVEFRIESQRKRNVDRSIPFAELQHSEQTVRILAALDDVRSIEALTNPAEDPADTRNARAYPAPEVPATPATTATSVNVDKAAAISAVKHAYETGLPEMMITALTVQALIAGAQMSDLVTLAAATTAPPKRTAHANEEKPWVLYNSDGRMNLGSYAVSSAVYAEQSALDHLISVYSPKSGETIEVTDEILTQAASLGHELLLMADQVQVRAYEGGRPDRQKGSYRRALGLVVGIVTDRQAAPIGGSADAISQWREVVTNEASTRLAAIIMIADPANTTSDPNQESGATMDADPANTTSEPAPTTSDFEPETMAALIASQDASQDPFADFRAVHRPAVNEAGFEEPTTEDLEAVRMIFTDAFPADTPPTIVSATAGAIVRDVFRATKYSHVHAPVLREFIDTLLTVDVTTYTPPAAAA